MELGEDTGRVEAVNQYLVGPHHFASHPVLHGLHQDCVAVYLSKDHDVLVPAAGLLVESPRLVGVNFQGCLVLHVQYQEEDCFFLLGQS